ncbi:MAG: UbiA family prenyltransferase [Thermodesulfobacteriota bacterium]
MNTPLQTMTNPIEAGWFADWKLFLGLSRTPHGMLDLATPAMAALLWLGHFPPVSVVVVGLLTAFAGYTAVYALNDLVDYKVDKERLSLRKEPRELTHVDEIMPRHPLAKGALPYRKGLVWCLSWSVVAVAGAWWLNPLCVAIYLISAGMETIYCKMLRITHFKVIPSAIVKASGGLAGVYAVDPSPSLGFVALLFLWLAVWEIGGQNIANDIVDMQEDQLVRARTVATIKGISESTFFLLAAVSMAVFGGIAIYWFAGEGVGRIYPIGAAVLGWMLLMKPAHEIYRAPGPETAAALFNRASYMPICYLVLVLVSIYLPQLTEWARAGLLRAS